jgi:hypothetical protein
MAGWFDGLFQGAAEVENRLNREDGEKPPKGRHRSDAGYLSGFRQGVLDARAVATFRRAEAARRDGWPPAGASGFSHPDPRT